MKTPTLSQDSRRVQLELSTERVTELDQLMAECGIHTRVELINTALNLLEWTIEERKNGRIIASVDEANMRFKELMIPAFSAVRAAQRRAAAGAG